MDTVKEQMEHHLSAGADSMAQFNIPPSMVCRSEPWSLLQPTDGAPSVP